MSKQSDISINIENDKNETDKINTDEPYKSHNDKSITSIEVSPNEKYLVTYSEDDKSIVGWNVDVDEGQLKPEFSHTDKINTDEPYKPHNGKSITNIEVSPDEKYLVTYSGDDQSIVGWNVEDIDEGQLKPHKIKDDVDDVVKKPEANRIYYISKMCVSNDKKVAYIIKDRLKIYGMNIDNVELDIISQNYYCIFNSRDELILYGYYNFEKIILIYSTQTKNNKWKYKRMYKIPFSFDFISISKYNKLYFYLNNSIYEWDFLTEKSIKIFGNEEVRTNVEISSNEEYIFIKFKDKIVIYSIELKVPLSLTDIQLNDFMCRTGLIRSLFQENVIKNFMKDYWKERLDYLKKNGKLPKEYQTKSLPTIPDNLWKYNTCITTKYAFGVLDKCVWKIKLEEEISKMNFSLKKSDEIMDKIWEDKINKETYETYERLKILKIHNLVNLVDPYVDIISVLFQEVISNYTHEEEKLEFTQNLIKWKIKIGENHDEIELEVFKKINDNSEWNSMCSPFKHATFHDKLHFCGIKLFDHNNIVILTTQALLIYHYNEYIKSISLCYYYNMDLNPVEKRIDKLRDYEKVFLKPTLPLPDFNNDSLRPLLLDSLKKDNEEWFLKFGFELLLFAIKKYHSNSNNVDQFNSLLIINDICQMCINYNNKEMLLKYVVELSKNEEIIFRSQAHIICGVYKGCIDYDNKEFLLKYGDKLLTYAIVKQNSEFIEEICQNCFKYNNKEIFLKYGVELLTYVIKVRNIELIDGIYKKCVNYFRDDPVNNRVFLSIIVSKMPLLNELYPVYISRFSLETTMNYYNIKYEDNNLHLCPLQYPQLINSIFSFVWLKMYIIKKLHIVIFILIIILALIFLPLTVTYFVILVLVVLKSQINSSKNSITVPTITFMIPYINFVNYPKYYKWYLEFFKPQPSPFARILSKDIYKTWDGEVLLNFKWNTYGKYYYAMIWIGFMALLGCFTAAATIPRQYIDDDVRKQLLIVSIILGFVHLNFEVRQMIYDFNKWIQDFWNIFDIIAFSLPIITSINWLQTNDMNVQLLSFSCLFLDIKFLLFFRVFESFGVYFAIIISVGKQIISFLVVLLIIIISFAHAFYILLLPRSDFSFDQYTNNTDPNNPWNMANTYNQVFDNETVDSFIIQKPDKNTNMFVDFGTALFGMYLFLTGDSSALSNQTYADNPSLVILFVLFSLLIVVYLMNLFIGLLNLAIDKDNDRISYLIIKAEILIEIELFYLFPSQRRWPAWFPDEIYYYANADKTRENIKEMMKNGEWNTDGLPEMRQSLLNELRIPHDKHDPVDEDTLRKILKEMLVV